jgi:cytochrome c oxidase assembly protein Cox11
MWKLASRDPQIDDRKDIYSALFKNQKIEKSRNTVTLNIFLQLCRNVHAAFVDADSDDPHMKQIKTIFISYNFIYYIFANYI